MSTESIIMALYVAIGFLIFIILALLIAYVLIGRSKKKKKDYEQIIVEENKESKEKAQNIGRFKDKLTQESILEFLEFDEIVDNMIIRKNRTQYLMVLQCNGINYDLLSEAEKIGVEEGFVQFLNTLRTPIQLYVQSRTLNLKDIINDYKVRINNINNEVSKIDIKIKQALANGNRAQREKLEYEKRRKENVLEYGNNIIEYVERMSSNKNILQQKTFVIVPYYSAELGGGLDDFSPEEIDGMCFSELYTRAQNLVSALMSSSVTCKILDSEELSELLYIAYNRDDSELYQFSKAIDAQYDALYSSGRDVLIKKQNMLDEQLNIEAIDLASDSILKADRRKKEEDFRASLENKQKIKQKAMNLVQEYQEQLEPKVYDYTVEEIEKYGIEEDKTPKKKAVKRRTRREE